MKALKKAEEKEDIYFIKLIKNKIKLDRIIEEKNFQIEVFNKKIDDILIKYKDINITWESIFDKMEI